MCMKTNSLLSQTCSVYCLLRLILIIFPALQAKHLGTIQYYSFLYTSHSFFQQVLLILPLQIYPKSNHISPPLLLPPLSSYIIFHLGHCHTFLNEYFLPLLFIATYKPRKLFNACHVLSFPYSKTPLHSIPPWTDFKGFMIVCNIVCNLFPLKFFFVILNSIFPIF